MPEPTSPLIPLLLGAALFLLVFLIALAIWILRRLSRIERRIAASASRAEAPTESPGQAETSPGGAFEMFLSEDPQRSKLPKSEQFAEYRKWRQEKGMNWSNS